MEDLSTPAPPKQRSGWSPKRMPIVPSDSENAAPRRPKARQVSSRYLSISTSSSSSVSSSSSNTTSSSVTTGSSISSRRSQPPMLDSKASMATPKSQNRSVYAERRLPYAVSPAAAEKVLVASVRNLSLSFQGQSLIRSKAKSNPATTESPGGLRKVTPERRKAGATPLRDRTEKGRENSRPSDQHPQHWWSGTSIGGESNFLSRSLDYGTERVKLNGSDSCSALKELRKFVEYGNCRSNFRAALKPEKQVARSSLDSDVHIVPLVNAATGRASKLARRPGRTVLPPIFGQGASDRISKVLDHASSLSISSTNRKAGPSKLIAAENIQNVGPVPYHREVFASRGLSPLREGARTTYPSKALPSPRVTPLINHKRCSTPSMLSFTADVGRRKVGENKVVDAYDLGLLYGRLLQWRFMNARLDNTLMVQKHAVERNFFDACMTTSNWRLSVKLKRTEMLILKHNLKLLSIIKEQIPHLESWHLVEKDHCNCLSGTIKALEASTNRLPIVAGARADAHQVQEAISSALDIMQAMSSSICSLQTKVEQMSLLASELSVSSARARCLLDDCKSFLSTTVIPLQLEDTNFASSAFRGDLETKLDTQLTSIVLPNGDGIVVLDTSKV